MNPEHYLDLDQDPPKVCKMMALMAVIMGLGLFFCILLGFR